MGNCSVGLLLMHLKPSAALAEQTTPIACNHVLWWSVAARNVEASYRRIPIEFLELPFFEGGAGPTDATNSPEERTFPAHEAAPASYFACDAATRPTTFPCPQ